MRGFAIWLVVIGHVIQYNHCVDWMHHPVFEWIYSFHLPLFFYVSGYLAYKTSHLELLSEFGGYVWKKFRSLIIPLVVWSLIVNRYFFAHKLESFGILDLWNVFAERGLWFLKYLFFISIIYGIIHLISLSINKRKSIWKDISIYAVTFFALVGIAQVWQPAIFMSTALFFSFFIMGVFISKYEILEKVICEPWAYAIAFVFFCLLSTHWTTDGAFKDDLLKVIIAPCSFVVMEKVSRMIEGSKAGHYLSILGKYSLSIYCSHWALLCIDSSISWDLTYFNDFWVLIIAAVLAVVVMACCVVFVKITEDNKWLGLFLFGKK